MITLDEILIQLYEKLKQVNIEIYNDELPPDYFDSEKNDYGVYYLVPNIEDGEYKEIIPFEIHIRFKDTQREKAIYEVSLFKNLDNQWWSLNDTDLWIQEGNPKILFPNDGTGVNHIIMNFRLNTNYTN